MLRWELTHSGEFCPWLHSKIAGSVIYVLISLSDWCQQEQGYANVNQTLFAYLARLSLFSMKNFRCLGCFLGRTGLSEARQVSITEKVLRCTSVCIGLWVILRTMRRNTCVLENSLSKGLGKIWRILDIRKVVWWDSVTWDPWNAALKAKQIPKINSFILT